MGVDWLRVQILANLTRFPQRPRRGGYRYTKRDSVHPHPRYTKLDQITPYTKLDPKPLSRFL
jgi:hypothetical protein